MAGALIVFKYVHAKLQFSCHIQRRILGKLIPPQRHSSITVTGMFNTMSLLPWQHLFFFFFFFSSPPFFPRSAVVIVDHCSSGVPGQSARRETSGAMYLLSFNSNTSLDFETFIRKAVVVYCYTAPPLIVSRILLVVCFHRKFYEIETFSAPFSAAYMCMFQLIYSCCR